MPHPIRVLDDSRWRARAARTGFSSFVVLLAATSALDAAPLFRAPSMQFETGHTPTSVAARDLNGDGALDLVVTNSGAYSLDVVTTVSVLLGNGDGTFAPRVDYEVGFRPQAVVIADLDLDGRLDLAVASYGVHDLMNGTVTILRGNGDGTFHSRVDYPAGSRLYALAVADIDDDGNLDLVTEKSVLLGNGDGTFQAMIPFGGDESFSVSVADLNGDGRLDVATVNRFAEPADDEDPPDPAVRVRLGNGDGSFGPPTGFGAGYRPYAVRAGDLDGDGRPDLAWANFGQSPDDDGSLSIVYGIGDGTFAGQRTFPTGINPISVAIGDVDGDGNADLATSNYGADFDFDSNSISVLLGNGDGTFRTTPELQVGENPRSVTIADLDADGAPDLITADEIDNTVSVSLGNGDGTFGTPAIDVGGYASALVTADFDADSHPDLAVVNYGRSGGTFTYRVSTFRGHGDGTFVRSGDWGVGGPAFALASGDLNGDGRLDLAVANHGYPDFVASVSVLLGSGDGTFQPKVDYSTSDNPSSIAIADVTADGAPDIVLSHYATGTIGILPSTGGGTFGPRFDVGTGSAPTAVAIGDLNGDGRADLVTANTAVPTTVSVLLANSEGSFQPRMDFPSGGMSNNEHTVVIADLDLDGHLDLVAGSSVLRGHGDGTFESPIGFSEGTPGALAVADFDLDGVPDLAASYPDLAGPITVQIGAGTGSFGVPLRFGAGGTPRDLVSADFDGDGDPDLAVANVVSQSVSILLDTRDDAETPSLLARFEAAGIAEGIELTWEIGRPERFVAVALERADAVAGPWRSVDGERRTFGRATIVVDRNVVPGSSYYYRLVATRGDGGALTSELLRVTTPLANPTVSMRVSPSPTRDVAQVDFEIAREARVRVGVHDVQGREVATLADAVFRPGRHTAVWDGKARGARAPAGVYLVRMESLGQRTVRRLLLIR